MRHQCESLGLSVDQVALLLEDHAPITVDALVRRICFGIVEVPSVEVAREELARRRTYAPVEERRATIAARRAYMSEARTVLFRK